MLLDEDLEEYLGSVESALKETLKNFYVERYEKGVEKIYITINYISKLDMKTS